MNTITALEFNKGIRKVTVTDTNGRNYINQMHVYVGQKLYQRDNGYFSYASDKTVSFTLPRIQVK